MQCKCGYCFAQERLKGNSQAFESYAVVNNKNYRLFIRSEIKAVQASDREKRLAAIARSSRHVGSLLECPQCSRILLLKPVKPGVWSREFYRKEESDVVSDGE